MLGCAVTVAAALALVCYRAPAPAPASAPASEFSATRALEHLRVIAAEPHSIGMAHHARVRQYLVATARQLGLEADVQAGVALNPDWGSPFVVAQVQNVLVTVPGKRRDGPAVLLVAHYDSVPSGPGASDDGAAVAALLECARALRSRPRLEHDVALLFTDGEEIGLLGARAFAATHPGAGRAMVALNFEARGTSGPSLMFETSPGNAGLIRALSAARGTRLFASSLSSEIYRRMPNDSDFTVLSKAGIPGLNFAYLDGFARYHTRKDDLASLDLGSLQHQGSYALALAAQLADARPPQREADAVYFDLLGRVLVWYPAWLVLPLAGAVTTAVLWVLSHGVRRRRLRWSGLGLGAGLALLRVAIAAVVVTAAWLAIRTLHPDYGVLPQQTTYNSAVYLGCFGGIVVAVSSTLGAITRARVSPEELAGGALLVVTVLLWGSALWLPGGSPLLTWPLLGGAASLALVLARPAGAGLGVQAALVLAACAAPPLLLLLPCAYSIAVALPLGLASVSAGVLALLLGLLVPQESALGGGRSLRPPLAALLVALGFAGAGAASAGFDTSRPRPDSLVYLLDADAPRARWVTSDPALDAWTSRHIPTSTPLFELSESFASLHGPVRAAAAPLRPLPAPTLEVVRDRRDGAVRVLGLRARPGRDASLITLQLRGAQLVAVAMGGTRLEGAELAALRREGGVVLECWGGGQDGVEIDVRVASGAPLSVRVTSTSFDLPAEITTRRPPHHMPAPYGFGLTDATLVTRRFDL